MTAADHPRQPGRPATLVEPVRVTLYVPRDLLDRVDAEAARRGVNRSEVIRMMLGLLGMDP